MHGTFFQFILKIQNKPETQPAIMTPTVWSYLAYLVLSITVTVWVARTLHKNGRIFLVDAFHGNEPLADSINHLLVVGFYLINVGFVSLALKYGDKPENLQGVFEALSTKEGVVLLVLGAMHFFHNNGNGTFTDRGVLPDAPPRAAADHPPAVPAPRPGRRGSQRLRLAVS